MAGTEVLMMEKFLLTQCLWPANIHILLVVLDTLQSFLLNPYRLNFWPCGLVSSPLHRDSGLDGNVGEHSIMTGMKGETCLSCLTIPSHANAFYDAFCLNEPPHWRTILNPNAISFIHFVQQEAVFQELFRKVLIIIIITISSSSISSIICSLKMCGDCRQLFLGRTQEEVSLWPHLTRKELSLLWQGEQNYATCDFFFFFYIILAFSILANTNISTMWLVESRSPKD